MLTRLTNGLTYQATVVLSDWVRKALPPADLVAQLQRHQLYGTVSQTPVGYSVRAQFRGRTGDYDLPEVVQNLVIVR